MHFWYRTLAWVRNVSFFIGVFLAIQGIRYWKSVGNDPNLRPDDTFIIAAALIGIPLVVTIFIKASLTDKMNNYANAGNKLLESGDSHGALDAFNKAIEIKDNINKKVLPEEMVFHLYRAKAFIKLNNEKKALDDINRITGLRSELEIWKKLQAEANELKSTLKISDKS